MASENTGTTGAAPASAIQFRDLLVEVDRLVQALPGHRRQTVSLVKTPGMSVLLMAMEGGDQLDEHSAPGAVTIHLLHGHIEVRTAEATQDLRESQLVVIEPGARHDVFAHETSVVLLTVAA